MDILSNNILRTKESCCCYVLLIKRINTVKGIAKGKWSKRHIPCTVKPQSMMKFKTEKAALEFWNKYSEVDPKLNFYKVAKLNIDYNLVL